VDLPLYVSFLFCKWLYYKKIIVDPTQRPAERARDVVFTLLQGIKLKTRVRPQPPAVVAISGPDGTGKTVHARTLADALQLSEINATYFWARGGTTGLARLSRLVRLLFLGERRDQTEHSADDDTITRRRRRLANPVLRFGWAWLVALDQFWTYGVRARLPGLLGHVVVSDRYVYDTAVEMDASLPPEARWSRLAIAAMLAAVPRPRFAYVLDTSAATARARKPDEPWHPTWETERTAYARLAERFGLRPLSTEGPFPHSNNRLVREIMMDYEAKIETPLNALFMANPSQRNTPDPAWTVARATGVAEVTGAAGAAGAAGGPG
jgi:thymidylate kinase